MIESDEGITVCDNKKKWLNEQHTDRVGTQLYMSPEQVTVTENKRSVLVHC